MNPRRLPTGPPSAGPPTRRCRESGLATLEWLLVVSVSALMAALVIAFVQRNLDRSVTQVADASDASPSAERSLQRAQTLADELAYRVEVESLRYDRYDYRFQDPEFWEDHFSTRCTRIREVFADLAAEGVSVEIVADFRVDELTRGEQKLRQIDFSEVPWIYGNLTAVALTTDALPVFTVCQVFLKHDPGYGIAS